MVQRTSHDDHPETSISRDEDARNVSRDRELKLQPVEQDKSAAINNWLHSKICAKWAQDPDVLLPIIGVLIFFNWMLGRGDLLLELGESIFQDLLRGNAEPDLEQRRAPSV